MTISAPDPFVLPELPTYPQGNQATAGRTLVSKALVAGESTAVFLTLGDSLMSNTVSSTYTPTQAKNQNFNVYDGGLYATVEPLLGCNTNLAQFNSGCFFTRAADALISGAVFQRVIHAPIAVGGSVLSDYAAGGPVAGRFAAAHRRLVANGLTPTHVFIMLGANDTNLGTSQASATLSLQSIIANIRGLSAANIFVARHSIFGLATSAAVQAAHAAVLDPTNKVFTGGDMDSLTSSANYWDNTHFNATGAAAAAVLATSAISAHP
ncbi:SGNH/GDSL hydrolase family protein [Bradyrhizobium sp. BR 10261]|uniref:SGNH/GDSL hydrolase family protein n=1 Tax=Bradyrhizobium sp. BR 10261 TaxID=2749992 RepID=UPI001C64964F|nr:SGNH/GDSL hydrolase family protein [Bradyrhizobium sp. BR 10261]MBW7967590.1 SGNH/GDSL hydrolase family protein [Bradyrhizobium sp. BR 10261]